MVPQWFPTEVAWHSSEPASTGSAAARARTNCPDRNQGKRVRWRSMPEVAVGNLFVIQKFYT